LKATPYFDGAVLSRPPDDVSANLGLLRVRSAVWFDTVFINPSGDAEPFEGFIRPLAQRWDGYDLSLLRLADATTFKVLSNWKLVLENFLDLAHVPWVHGQLRGPGDKHSNEPTVLNDDIFGYLLPLPPGDRFKGAPPLPRFPAVPERFKSGLDLIMVFPNTCIILTPIWAQVIIVHPDNPLESSEVLAAYVVGDSLLQQNADADRKQFVNFLQEVNNQDVAILSLQQNGRQGSATDAGRFAPHWDGFLYRFSQRVAKAYG
jgi:phenylpropionate dioxygenase-like ring-hydroxylating dioxygenase large terminal subunit